ncbi:hypothetical protein IAD21_02453 [Abditibacteriota bacterium]|nr:hypothetical protein IAD21_02453 [Abditibacteriota bacterium]
MQQTVICKRAQKCAHDKSNANDIRRHWRLLMVFLVWISIVLSAGKEARGGELTGAYTDPSYGTEMTFGRTSHYIQPWRGYLETMPASQFIDGVGIGLNIHPEDGENADLIVQHLAKNGVKLSRIEIGWGSVNWDETGINSDWAGELVRACSKWHVRPVILLNAHHGGPCPARFFERGVTADAPVGSRTVTLDDVSGLVIGRSGFSQLTDYWAAEVLVTAINGNTVTLSKPLPKAFAVGQRVPMATLKYAPFSPVETALGQETLAGWQRYVRLVARFVRDNQAKAGGMTGFDMEAWNEGSFGSGFLDLNHYYSPPIVTYPGGNGEVNMLDIVKATARTAEADLPLFAGVEFGDGFTNTTPWHGAGNLPARFTAINKHPYSGVDEMPKSDRGGVRIDAQGHEDKSGWVPTYTSNFPEYFASAIQTEHVIRDMGPFNEEVYGTWKHGRYYRGADPVWVWCTEANKAPNEMGITDRTAALDLKARGTARFLCFYLNKGVSKFIFYAAAPNDKSLGDTELGIVQSNFLDYAKIHTAYPQDDASYTSPALMVIRRMVAQFKNGLDPTLTLQSTRKLTVNGLSDTHDHTQFIGDGTPAHPNLYNRDVFAFLPFQVNRSKFVIPYYVITRNMRPALPPENYTIDIAGINSQRARVSVYDPLNDSQIPLAIKERGDSHLKVQISATDAPRLLIVDENIAPR